MGCIQTGYFAHGSAGNVRERAVPMSVTACTEIFEPKALRAVVDSKNKKQTNRINRFLEDENENIYIGNRKVRHYRPAI